MDMVISFITGGIVGVLSPVAQNFFRKKELEQKRNYETKIKIYVKLAKILERFWATEDDKTFRHELYEIWGEIQVVAPDIVIYSLRDIFLSELNQNTGKISRNDVNKLLNELRRDLLPNSKIQPSDHFYLTLKKEDI